MLGFATFKTVMTTADSLKTSLRADMARWAPEVLRQAALRLESAALRNAVAADREHTASVLTVLQGRTDAFAQGWIQATQALMEEAAPTAQVQAGQLTLSMLAEDQIDEDIEVARIVQSVESEAEWELRQFAALCSGLQGRDGIAADANPLHPGLVARALRRSLDPFNLHRGARLLLLKQVGPLLGKRLQQVYAQQCAALEQQGVQPAHYRVRQASCPIKGAPSTANNEAPADAMSKNLAGAGPTAETLSQTFSQSQAGTLARLVKWALRSAPPAAAEKAPDGDTLLPLRLLTELIPAGSAPRQPSLSSEAAVLVMEQLLATLARQTSISEGMRALMRRLDGPARELAAHDAGLWRSLEHPWWQLLDRMISAGSVQDAVASRPSGAVSASLEGVVSQLEAASAPDATLVRGALAKVDAAVTGLMEEHFLQLGPAAASMQASADREEVEIQLRDQVVQQLRLTPAPAALRQFLLGPWVIAMAQAAVAHGQASHELRVLAALVDELIAIGTREPRHTLPPRHLEDLVQRAGAGLAGTPLAPARVARELQDLRAVLLHPTLAAEPSPDEYTDTLPVGDVIGGHAGLPTVPIDMVDTTTHPTPASQDRKAWIESLEPGDYCRIFLQARWMTAQLTWRSGNRNMFVFASRHGGRAHSLTRRALEKLRSAGLVTTMEHGELIAWAMDSLIEDDVAR